MKRLFLLILLISVALFLNNCDDAGITEDANTTEVSGTVTPWTLGVKILKAIVKDSSGANMFLADSTTIASDGSFILHIKTPPDNFFWPYSVPTGANCSGTITITPAGLKQTTVSFEVYSDTNTYIGKLQKISAGFPVTPGSHSVSYVNFKDAGSINGTTTCSDSTYSSKVTANYTAIAGWNTVVLKSNIYNPIPPAVYDVTIQNDEPAASVWFLGP